MSKKKPENNLIKTLALVFEKNPWLFLFIGLLPAILSVSFEFTNWDDPGLVIENPSIRSLSFKNIVSIFTPQPGKTYQPVRVLSYALDYKLGGLNPRIYHLHNLVLYAINLFLVYLLFLKLTSKEGAVIAALFWGLMPVHIESVAWVAARKEVLSGLFFFLSLIGYVDFRKGKGWIWYVISLVSFALAILSKPTAVVMPLILGLYELFFEKKKRFDYNLPYWFPNLLILAYFIFWGGAKKPEYHGGSIFSTLISNTFIALRYCVNMFLPVSLSPRYLIIVKEIFPGWRAGLGIVFVVVVLIIAWLIRKTRPIISFGILWFFLSLLPVLNIIPISTMMADRYIYLPSAGIALIFGVLCIETIKKLNYTSYIVLAYLILLLGISIFYSRVWRNSYTLWSYVIAQEPRHPLAHHNLGLWYVEKGENIQAYREFKLAVEYDPLYANAYKSLSGICWKLGKYDEGIKAGLNAVRLNRFDSDAYYNLGNNYLSSGRFDDAYNAYTKALELAPNDAKIWLNLGTLFYNMKKFDKAIEHFEKARSLDPNEPLAYLNICATYFELSHLSESRKCYEEFLLRFPNLPETSTAKAAINIIDSLITLKRK